MDRFGLDIFNPGAERIKTVAALAARGYASSMVLAHDANGFIDYFGAAHDQVRAAAAPNWPYEHIGDDVLPSLLDAGVTQAQLDTMLVENPVRYFTPGGGASSSELEERGIFDMTGVTRGPDGVKHYDTLPGNLVQMLRASVERQGAAEAVAETGGGPRLSYVELWDRAARAGRAACAPSDMSSAATGWRSGWATASAG